MKYIRVAVAMTVICSLLLTSCETVPQVVKSLELSVRNSKVSSSAGSMFVNVKSNDDWTISLEYEGASADWASLDKTSGNGNFALALSYGENKTGSERVLDVKAKNSDGSLTSSVRVTQEAAPASDPGQNPDPDPGQNPEPDPGQDPNPEPEPEPEPVVTGWLELPQMDDPQLTYRSYSFDMNGKTYRNYTIGYSEKDYLAKWVAYPINKTYTTGSYKGDSEDWDWNPDINRDSQPDFDRSFGFSKGYERGHQIANADRKCSRDANLQTFYFTNSTLQHKNFNGAIWATLEGNLRSVPKNMSDTLYVVTGCVLSDDPEYIQDPDGKMVPVPAAYFKAAVSYTASSTLGAWKGAAFYLEHKTYSYENITAAESMTIDALEEKLGIDFFVNLPLKLGEQDAAAVEAQNPTDYASVWGIR